MDGLSSAVFPGSFDPLTNGHTDIIDRSLKIFDRVIVAVLSNAQKDTLYTVEERVQLIREVVKPHGDRIQVESFSGLLVDFVSKMNSRVIIRGLRAVSDYDYETQMALVNRNLRTDIETFFLMTAEANSYISSSIVKQVAKFGGDITKLVPAHVADSLYRKLKSAKRD